MSDEPASKSDVARLEERIGTDVARLEQRIDGVRTDVARLDQRIDGVRTDMQAMEKRLILEIGHALNVAVEQIGKMVGVVEDKYQDLPGRVTALEEHAADSSLHTRRPSAPPKRSRRRPPRK